MHIIFRISAVYLLCILRLHTEDILKIYLIFTEINGFLKGKSHSTGYCQYHVPLEYLHKHLLLEEVERDFMKDNSS
jgi:hypothetical protein